MKIWRITTTIHSEDDYDAKRIAYQIDRDVRRSDGLFIKLLDRLTPIPKTITFVRKIKDKN